MRVPIHTCQMGSSLQALAPCQLGQTRGLGEHHEEAIVKERTLKKCVK